MTAQASERLIFKGNRTWMAAEPLNQYLRYRNDIKFISHSTGCWRGYYGQWEIKDNKLYIIGLNAYIEGGKEVGLDYLFPGQEEVFANWFNGEIRIPQGEILDYVHMGYYSLYESDLFLVFENGILVNQYEVDNEKEYQNRLKLREQEERELGKMLKTKKNYFHFTHFTFLAFAFIVVCVEIFMFILIIKKGTVSGYLKSAILAIGGIFLFFQASFVIYLLYFEIKNRIKLKRKAAEMKKWGW